MKPVRILSTSSEETKCLGETLARHLRGGDILCLRGDLGSGKTTLIKGIAQGLKIAPAKVHSPTFVLMNAYEGRLPLYHFDLYRLEEVREISTIGYEEFLYGDGVSVIEWAERFGELTPKEYLGLYFAHKGGDERSIRLEASGQRYVGLLKKLKK